MRVIFTFWLAALFSTAAFGQQTQSTGTLIGRVEGIEPASAEVQIRRQGNEKTRFWINADQNGDYRFENVPAGKYTVYASSTKISDIEARGTVRIDPGKTSVVNLEMGPALISEKVTVSIASDGDQSEEEVSKSVSVVTGQEMRDRADITLADSLRTIPGFRVQQLGGFGRTASIKSRGLRNQDTAILIDGMRFRDPTAIAGDASPFLSDLTLTSVSRVEVLRGPGSSLYGTNAIGGTVDFQTPVPQTGWHGQASGAGGGLGLGRFRGNLSNGTDDGKFGISGAISRTVYTKGIDGSDDANNTNFQSRVEFNPYKRTNVSARLFLSDAQVRLNSSPDTKGIPPASNFGIIDAVEGVNFAFDADDPDSMQKSRSFNGQLVLTQSINDKLAFQAYYSGLSTRRRNDNGILGFGFQSASTSVFEGAIHTANGHVDWTPHTANRLTVGYEFEHEDFLNEGFTPSGTEDFFTNASQSSSTIYLQNLVSLLEGKLQFAGGFRAQFHRLQTPGFSLQNAPYSSLTLEDPPAAYTVDGSASYFIPSSGTKLRVHGGNSYRVPSLFERFGTFFNTFPTNSFVALGDPNLKPEKAAAFDAGLDQYFWGRRVTASAVFFYSKLTDIIGFGNVAPDIGTTTRPFGGYVNQTGGVSRGVEMSGEVKPTSSTSIFASYTFTNSDQIAPQVTGSGVFTTLGVPEHQFTFNATQRAGNFWVNADFLGASSYLAPVFSNFSFKSYVYRFEGNRRIDLTTGYKFPINKERFNVRIFLTVENILDQEYFENGFRTIGRTARIGLNFGF